MFYIKVPHRIYIKCRMRHKIVNIKVLNGEYILIKFSYFRDPSSKISINNFPCIGRLSNCPSKWFIPFVRQNNNIDRCHKIFYLNKTHRLYITGRC